MIIFINGSINSGKTTVSKLLASRLSNIALVELDDIRNMFSWMPLEEAIPITLDIGINLIKDLVKNNMSVIVSYPLSQKNYDLIIKKLSGIKQKIYFFTLAPKLEKVIKNRGSRKLTKSEKGRIKYHYDIGIHNPSFGITIDNTNQTPEETVEEILKNLD
jgi:adenylate kinase family enzyme